MESYPMWWVYVALAVGFITGFIFGILWIVMREAKKHKKISEIE